jgi:hypothetical protein
MFIADLRIYLWCVIASQLGWQGDEEHRHEGKRFLSLHITDDTVWNHTATGFKSF